MTSNGKKNKTPDSATARDAALRDDEAVSKSVNTESDARHGTTSVLPGPPIPPEIQDQLRNERQIGETSGRRGPSSQRRTKENVND